MPKRSRLVRKYPVQISNGKKQNGCHHLKSGHKKCPKNDHLNTGQSGIWWITVLKASPVLTKSVVR
jgi:hypothetical protein